MTHARPLHDSGKWSIQGFGIQGAPAPANGLPANGPPATETPATGGSSSKQRGRTAQPPPGAAGGGGGGDDDEGGGGGVPKALTLCFVDSEGDAVPALPEPKGKPLPLLAAKSGAAQMRKAIGPVLDAVLAHLNKDVAQAQQLSLMAMTTHIMGSRQVSGRHAGGLTCLLCGG